MTTSPYPKLQYRPPIERQKQKTRGQNERIFNSVPLFMANIHK